MDEAMCDTCNKQFSSVSKMYYHKREKHTHFNCKYINCSFCELPFYSVLINTNRPDSDPKKCEDCCELQFLLETNDLVSGTFVYTKNKRVYLDKGSVIPVCNVVDCKIKTNEITCRNHEKEIKQCQGSKCLRCYEDTGFNFCEKCRETGDTAKMKVRYMYKELKEQLGGICVACGENDMFKLEFDHIDESKKTKQITRMYPSDPGWDEEIKNIQLLCGICHRIKNTTNKIKGNVITRGRKYTNRKYTNKKYEIIHEIKRAIGGCQSCGWEHKDNESFNSSCLDFDHIIGEKYKSISKLINHSWKNLIEEIRKTRLLCRNCHQLYTCFELGGRNLVCYYNEEQIKELRHGLYDEELKKEANEKVNKVLDEYIYLIKV
jgi:hypothetical protein